MLDSFLKGPVIAAGFAQHLFIAILYVYKAQFVLVFIGFVDRISQAVHTMPGIKAQTNLGVRCRIEEQLTLLGRFYVCGHVRMKNQIETEFICHHFGIRNDFSHMLPLFGGESGAVLIVSSSGKPVPSI